jgi:hypothetical protein
MKEILNRLANVVYWGCYIVAALLMLGFIIDIVNPDENFGTSINLWYAFFIWLFGWVTRYILTGNKAFKP